MANYFAPAVVTFRRHGVDGALEAIEIMRDTRRHDLDGFIILVSANFTFVHKKPLSVRFIFHRTVHGGLTAGDGTG